MTIYRQKMFVWQGEGIPSLTLSASEGLKDCFYNETNCSSWILKSYGIIWRWELDCSLSKCRNCMQSRNFNLILALYNNFFQQNLNQKNSFWNQGKFHLQKSFWNLNLQIKSYAQILERMFENVKGMSLLASLWNLSTTLDWSFKISNGVLKMKFNLIFHINLVQSFLKKNNSTLQNEDWNFILTTIPCFGLTMSGWAPTDPNFITRNFRPEEGHEFSGLVVQLQWKIIVFFNFLSESNVALLVPHWIANYFNIFLI